MSAQVYRGVVELCVVRYRDAEGLYVGTREAAFCALRAQLLMALHDAGATELCSQVLLLPAMMFLPMRMFCMRVRVMHIRRRPRWFQDWRLSVM